MKKVCENCKHWIRNKESYQSKKYGRCNCESFEYGSSFHYGKEDNKITINDNSKLLYQDHDNYSADFETGENFGCIHFKSEVE